MAADQEDLLSLTFSTRKNNVIIEFNASIDENVLEKMERCKFLRRRMLENGGIEFTPDNEDARFEFSNNEGFTLTQSITLVRLLRELHSIKWKLETSLTNNDDSSSMMMLFRRSYSSFEADYGCLMDNGDEKGDNKRRVLFPLKMYRERVLASMHRGLNEARINDNVLVKKYEVMSDSGHFVVIEVKKEAEESTAKYVQDVFSLFKVLLIEENFTVCGNAVKGAKSVFFRNRRRRRFSGY